MTVPQRRPALDYELSEPSRNSPREVIASLVPGVTVLRSYRRRWLRTDMFAGVAVAAYLVPQVMAYAAIVGTPPVTGLWTALAACLAYAVLGGSRVLSVGPESTVALIAGATIAPLAQGDPQRVAALSAGLCVIVAGWCLLARLARLGVIADLLSQPLLIGYLAGGAVLMVVGQLGRLTRTDVEGESIVQQIVSFASVVGSTHAGTLIVGAATLALIVAVVLVRPMWPAPLIAVSAATLASGLLNLPDRGVSTIGQVPTGLPPIGLPVVSWGDLSALTLTGLGVAVVAYSDNTLVGRAFRPKPDPEETAPGGPRDPDPQQELVALGGVHLAVAAVGGFPVSSSGSRSALAMAAGARSQLYSLVAAACIVAVLLFAGPLLSAMPAAALGAVVVYAASKLVSRHEFVRLARFRVGEFLLAVVTCLATVVLGILAGVGVAIALSLLEMTRRLARPHEGVLGLVEGMEGRHDVDDYPEAQTLTGLIIYRYDAPLFFANVGDLHARALLAVERENRADPAHPVRWFVLNVEANVEIDITAADGLRHLHEDLDGLGVRLGLARVKQDLREPLERAGLIDLIGEDMIFTTLPVTERAYLDWARAQPDR